MGREPIAGAVLIVGGSLVWYYGYVRRRVDREGVARDEVRRRVGKQSIERTKAAFETDADGDTVVVALAEDADPDVERTLVRIGGGVAADRDASVTAVRFDEVPDQLPLSSAREVQSSDDVDFERRMDELAAQLPVPLEYGEIVSHDAGHAVTNFADHDEADLLVVGGGPVGVGGRLLGRDADWIARHAPCDLLMVDAERLEDGDTVALVTDRGPFDPLKAQVADAVAVATDGTVELVQTVAPNVDGTRADTLGEYQDDLAELFSVPVRTTALEDDDPETVAAAVADAGLVIVGSDDSAAVRRLDDRNPDEIVDAVRGGAVVVRPHGRQGPTPLRRLVERLAF